MKIKEELGQKQIFFSESEVLEALCEWCQKRGNFIFEEDIKRSDFLKNGVYIKVVEGHDVK